MDPTSDPVLDPTMSHAGKSPMCHAKWCTKAVVFAHRKINEPYDIHYLCPEHTAELMERDRTYLVFPWRQGLSAEQVDTLLQRWQVDPETDPGHVHRMFGLTYSAYQVLPRVVLQSMPPAWQHRFVELLAEIGREFPEIECGPYDVRLEDGSDDPYRHYRHRRLTPKPAQEHEPL